MDHLSYGRHRFPPAVIRHAIWLPVLGARSTMRVPPFPYGPATSRRVSSISCTDRRRSGETATHGGLTDGHLKLHLDLHHLDGRDRRGLVTVTITGRSEARASRFHTAATALCHRA